jgi:hypothetical protein
MTKVSYDDLYQKAIELLVKDTDLFNNMCKELDSWDGFLGDDRYYLMYEFDELLYGKSPLEIAELVSGEDFNTGDDYFRFTMYGVESTSDVDYSEYYSAEDVLDRVIDDYGHLWFSDDDFKDIVEALDNRYDYYDYDTLEEWEDDKDEE